MRGLGIEARFLAKVEKTATCWNWIGCRRPRGYGMLNIGGKIRSAHRVAYEMYVGPIPAGREIDHLCRNTSCVKPEHLEAVTHKENVLRGVSLAAGHAKQTHCDRGHEFDEGNTLFYDGGRRRCRKCTTRRNLGYYHKYKGGRDGRKRTD